MTQSGTPIGSILGSPILPALVAAFLLSLYAAQLSLGRWQIDEFLYFANHRLYGWHATLERLYVSPRPLSELLIHLYGWAVLAAAQPLVATALGLLWSAVLIAIGLAAWTALGPSRLRLATAASLGLAPMVFAMAANPVTEMFYWPVAAVAYLPAVAGATALLFLLGDGRSAPRKVWCGAALTVCATSHEIGAALALGFAAATVALTIVRRPGQGGPIVSLARDFWWIMPAVISACVIAGLIVFRAGIDDFAGSSKPYAGHLAASALAAAWQLAIDMVTVGNWSADLAGIAGAVVWKSIFAAGFALVWLRSSPARIGGWWAVLAFALCGAAYFSLAAAYYHYGDLCCERHATTRQWLLDLIWIIAAGSALSRLQQRVPGWAGPALLTLSLLPVLFQAGAIQYDLNSLPMAQEARLRTWASGQQPGPGPMVFYLPPDSPAMLIHGTSEPVGTYPAAAAPEFVTAVGRFFGKTMVTVCEPWQTEKSWLYDGKFIPACPPHPGPPDIVYNSH